MALIVADRVVESSTTTGTGALTLAGAYTGYRAFSAVCSTNDTLYYTIEAVDANGNPSGAWETGLGTYSGASTLTRTSVSASTNSNNAVNFAAGAKRVSLNVTAAHVAALQPLDADLTDIAAIADAQGDIIIRGSAGWERLATGTAGQFLRTGGAGANPAWSAPRICMVKKSTDHTAQNYSAGVTMSFDAEVTDADGCHDNVTNNSRITSPSWANWARVGGFVTCANVTAGAEYQLTVLKGGSGAFDGATGMAAEMPSANISAIACCASGWFPITGGTDYFELFFRLSTDTSIDITAARTNFWAEFA